MAWPRRMLHMKGDIVCTMLLLLLACLLLFIQQILLSSRWDTTTWRLQVQASTSSRQALLTHSGAIMDLVFPEVPSGHGTLQQPACKPQESSSKTGISQSWPKPNNRNPNLRSKGKTKSKGKGQRKTAVPTKAAGSPLSTRPPFDFAGYLREKDNRYYQLIINQPEKCTVGGEEGSSSSAPYMLVAVKSIAADFDKRQVVRRTWGMEGLFQNGVLIRRVFLLGVPRNGSALPLWDRLLAYESDTFKDILLWDFEDTFFNLTLKETHFLLWVNLSCPAVRFIFKGDADVYVNMENILEMLWGRSAEEDLFVGDIILHARPIRRRSSKYYVPGLIYGGALYPTYAGGGGFVMSGHTARRLSAACEQVELFPIDDVFLGMCLQLIGVKPWRHDGFRTFGIPRPSAAPHLQMFDPCFYRDLMVVHSLTVPQIWLMWNLLHDPKLSCHTGRRPTPWPFRWRERAQTTVETDYVDAKSVFVNH